MGAEFFSMRTDGQTQIRTNRRDEAKSRFSQVMWKALNTDAAKHIPQGCNFFNNGRTLQKLL